MQRNNLEAILSYAPDLVVVPDWDGIDFVGQLRSAGIKVYVHKTPNTMQKSRLILLSLLLLSEKMSRDTIAAANG
ncbi:MAG: hypothetical protein ACLRXQ_13130 [Phascolarctobacterium faecium]